MLYKRRDKKGRINAVQEVVSALNTTQLIKEMVITNSYFTKSALHCLARSNEIELWDRRKIKQLYALD